MIKLGVYRVYFHTITERYDPEKDKQVEVSRTSPVMKMLAAENQGDLQATLPEPPPGPEGTTTRNVILQIDQRSRDVLFNERKL